MKYRIFEVEYNDMKFKIEEDLPEVGVYLYVYHKDKCEKDYLQDNIEVCKQIAFEEFGVPYEKWNVQ